MEVACTMVRRVHLIASRLDSHVCSRLGLYAVQCEHPRPGSRTSEPRQGPSSYSCDGALRAIFAVVVLRRAGAVALHRRAVRFLDGRSAAGEETARFPNHLI